MLDCQFNDDKTRYSIAFKRDNSAGTRQGYELSTYFQSCLSHFQKIIKNKK